MPLRVLIVCSSNARARFWFCFMALATVSARSNVTRSRVQAHAIPIRARQDNTIGRFALACFRQKFAKIWLIGAIKGIPERVVIDLIPAKSGGAVPAHTPWERL